MTMTRAELERVVVGRRIVAIEWSETDNLGQPASDDGISAIPLDGYRLTFSGSAQVEIDSVFVDLEVAL